MLRVSGVMWVAVGGFSIVMRIFRWLSEQKT